MILTGVRALPGEEWRPVVGYEDKYLVSNLGRVYSIPRPYVHGGLLRPAVIKRGYLRVSLGGDPNISVHRVVAHAFHGAPLPEQTEVRHLNGDPADNRAENLMWGTPAENAADCVRHGTHNMTRKTHCPQGHPYDGENTVRDRDGSRHCRICRRATGRRADRRRTPRRRARRDEAPRFICTACGRFVASADVGEFVDVLTVPGEDIYRLVAAHCGKPMREVREVRWAAA